MFPRLSVASPRPPPRLQALRRRPLRALRPPPSQAQWHGVIMGCFHPLPPAALLSLASGKGRQCTQDCAILLPSDHRPVSQVAEGESSSWSNEARRTRTRSGREGTRRGTERSPRRRLGRTNLTVGRGEPARAGCFSPSKARDSGCSPSGRRGRTSAVTFPSCEDFDFMKSSGATTRGASSSGTAISLSSRGATTGYSRSVAGRRRGSACAVTVESLLSSECARAEERGRP